jgi:hypothetical protein
MATARNWTQNYAMGQMVMHPRPEKALGYVLPTKFLIWGDGWDHEIWKWLDIHLELPCHEDLKIMYAAFRLACNHSFQPVTHLLQYINVPPCCCHVSHSNPLPRGDWDGMQYRTLVGRTNSQIQSSTLVNSVFHPAWLWHFT